MSSASSHDTKQRVKEAIDIVDLVGATISLRRQGRNFVGLCPWHDDSRPSLQVNPERQTFKCWVCNLGGDVFSYVMQREGVTFPEALRILADRAGITLAPQQTYSRPRSSGGGPSAADGDVIYDDDPLAFSDYGPRSDGPRSDGPRSDRTTNDPPVDKPTLYRAMAWAVGQYHQCLLHSEGAEPARRYLAERGINADSIARFELGYSPLSWDWIIKQLSGRPSAAKILEQAGILARSERSGQHYDRFRGRVLFPIRDVQGHPIALGGRVLPEVAAEEAKSHPDRHVAKYINSPETPLFAKNREFYALDLARDAVTRGKNVLVMEGYTDVIVAHQYGFHQAVAVLGTALGENHIRRLRFADQCGITLVLDGDDAGRRRANQILELFVAAQVDLRILTLPDDLDPCDFLHQRGAAAFESLLPQAVDALDHKVRQVTAGVDPNDTHQAHRSIEDILTTLAAAPRLSGATTEASRMRLDHILSRLARTFRIPEVDLRSRLAALRRRPRGTADARRDPAQASIPVAPTAAWERELVELLLVEPEATAGVAETVRPGDIGSPQIRRIYETCCQLAADRQTPTVDRLLLHLDDPQVQSLLVELDERGRSRLAADAPVRLQMLLETFRRRRQEQQHRDENVVMERQHVGIPQDFTPESIDRLQRMIAEMRTRQGITKPTEG